MIIIKHLFPVPGEDDWPEFYSVHPGELDSAKKLFLNNENEYAQEDYYLDEINHIFETAKLNKMDLVLYCYSL